LHDPVVPFGRPDLRQEARLQYVDDDPRPFAAIRKNQGLSRLKPIERLDTFAMIDLPPQAGIAPRVAVPLHRIAGNPAVSGER